MKKITLKFYDKWIVSILFSVFFLSSCKPDEPVPAYGIVPMYGAPTSTVSIHKILPTNSTPLK